MGMKFPWRLMNGCDRAAVWIQQKCGMRDARCEIRDARCEMRDARCEMRDARCEMRDARCEMRDAGYEMRDARCGIWKESECVGNQNRL
jgi:hypothetical protein